MSPMAPDDLLLQAGILTPGSKVAAGMASAAPKMQQPAQASGGWAPAPPDLLQRAQVGRFMVGGPDSRMAMFPDEFPEAKADKPNVVMRGIRGIAAGIADMAPSTMALAASVIDFMGADEAGAQLGQASLDVSSWLNDHLAVENPNLYDHAMRGVGSMLTFILPGIGAASVAGKVATAAKMTGKVALAFRALTGGTAMSFLESAVEQSQREMELIGQGKTPEQAMKESAPIFWHNMGVLMATNTVSYFLPLPIKVKNEFVRRAAKAVEAAFTEGGQERAQAVIQDVAAGRGEWADFLDPHKNVTDTLVGAIVGGGTAFVLPGEADTPQNAPAAPKPNAPVQPSQRPAKTPTPQQAPAQAAPAAPQPTPPAAPAAPIPVPAGLPMEPVEGFDVWTGQQEDEDAAPPLAQTPAQQETPKAAPAPVAAPTPTREIVNHLINEQDGTVSEVIAEPDGTFSVDTTDSESGNRIELRKRFPTQDAADEHARLMTGKQEQEAVASPAAETPAPAEAAAPASAKPVSPLVAARTKKSLDSTRRFNGRVMTIREYVESAVADGATVATAEGQRVLMRENGTYIRQSELTKTGMDYAQGLIQEQAQMASDQFTREAAAPVVEPDLVQRIEEPGVGRAEASKPHGIYTTPASAESPHKGLGGKRYLWRKNKDAKVLDVSDSQGADTAMRKGAVDSGAGVAAVRGLLGDGRFQMMRKMSKPDLIKYAKGLGVEADLSGYYDAQEVMEAIGADLARKDGYDAISSSNATDPSFSEYVALTDNAMTPVDDGTSEQPAEAPAAEDPEPTGRTPQQEADYQKWRQEMADINEDEGRDEWRRIDEENQQAEPTDNSEPGGYTQAEKDALTERFKNNSEDDLALVGDVVADVDVVDGTPISAFDLTSEQVKELARDAQAVMNMVDKGQEKMARKAGNAVASKLEKMVRATRAAEQKKAPAPAPEPAGTAGGAAAGIVSMPTSDLTVSKPGEFQKRENVDNPESQTNEAKMQAIMADFKPERLTPIVAWRDPVDGKLKVLDGHHTLEAAKRAGIENVNVREFTGTREEATTEAEILNDLRTANDPLSRASTVRRRRAAGMSEADIEAEARPRYQEATPTVLQLSHLNPNGQVVASIRQLMGSDQDSDSTSDLMKMAKWIGEARRRNPNLTDAHEQEMFDALREDFQKKPWAKNAQAFTKHVKGLATAEGFDANSRLNLGLDKRTPAEKKFDAELAAAQAAVDEAQAKHDEKSVQLSAAGIDVGVKDKLLKPFREAVDIAKADVAVLDGSRERYLEAERNQGGLFRMSGGGKWAAVMSAYGDWKILGYFPTKAAAIEAVEMDQGKSMSSRRQGGYYELDGSHIVTRSEDLGIMGYTENESSDGGEGSFRLANPSLSKLNKAATKRGLTPATFVEPRDLMDEMVVRVAKMFGFKNVQFVTGLAAPNGQMAHGYYQQESDTVFLNAGSPEPMLTVLMHEVGHRMEVEHPDLYGQLIAILNDPANVRKGAKEIYGKDAKARGYTEAGVEREWVSDGLMEASSRPEFWNVLQEKNPTLAGKLINMIVDAIKAIRKMFSASGASVDIYYNNFGPLVRQIANVAAQMQAREAELARSEKTAKDAIKKQPSMFRVAPALRKIATWFSGTGTLEAVLSNAKGVHAVEYSPEIIAQHNKAYGTNYTARDVTEIDPLEVAGTGADHFHASPVCKNFSKAKRNRGSNNLDIASARAVVGVILKAGMPSITIENVTDYIGTEPYKMIIEALKKAGYTQRTVKVNAADYGGAQNRTRMVIQAVKDGNLPPLPDKTGPTDWFAAIEDLLPGAEKSTVEAERVKGRGWNWEPDRIAKMVERGELDADLPIITMGGSTDKIRAWAANSGGPAPTLKATKGETVRIIMPDGTVYKATPRMLARLMGMPDSFQIPENYGFAKKVLGNGIHGAITKAFIEPLVNGERGTSPVSEDTAGQIEMFRIAPIANPLANEMRDKQDVAMKANNQHRHQGWSAGWRHVYMNMVDKHTFTFRMVRDIVKAANPKLAKDFSLAKSPYIALRRFGSWMTAVEVALKYGVYSFDGQTVLAPGMEQIIKKHGLSDAIDSREFGMFYTAATLVSRKYSLASRGKDFFGDDPASDEYQAAEDEFLKWQKIYDDYRKANPKWEDAVADFTKYAYALIQRSYEARVINEREFKDLTTTYSTYAPLFVIESSRYDVDRGDPVGAGSVAHEMTRFDPTAVRMDPIDALIKQTYHMEFFTRRNTAAQQHGDFIKKYRDKTKKGVTVLEGFGMRVRPKEDPVAKRVQQLLEAAGLSEAEIAALGRTPEQLEREAKMYVTSRMQPDGVIALLRDGDVEYWQLDPDIYESFMAATGPKAMHPMMKFFSAQTSLLRAGAVLTPDFMARNQFRDFASSAIISQHLIRNPVDPFLLPVRILRGLSAAIHQTEAYKEFILEVGHAQLHAQDQNGLRKTSEQATRDARGRFNYVLHSSPITILQEFGKLTENSTRYAVYWKTKTDLLKMGWSESEARVKAAMEARESSIDFARSGKYGQVINQIIPFFNAAVQGNDKALRTFVIDDGGRGAAWLKATMLVTVPSVLLWALNHDDEWYKDQPIWLKNNFWLFSVDGGKTIHKLPKPFEIGLTYASLPERFLDWQVDKDPKAMKEWSEAILKNVVAVNDKNPIASVGGLLGPMAGTMTEIVSNYDSFRGTPIVKGWLEEVVPREQYNANTTEFAKAMGGMAPGRGISPMMIDHFIRGTFGGLGAYASQLASEVIMLARPELKAMKPSDKQIHTLVGADVPDWIPVIRAFATASPSGYTRQMNDFFEIYDRGREASKTIQAFKASGAPMEKFKAEYRRSGAEIATFKASQEVAEKLGQISKRARFIESLPSTEMTRDEKRKQIDQLTETRNLMVKKFLERYYEIDQRDLQRQIDESLKQMGR